MRKWLGILLVLLLGVGLIPAQAQDKIEYGQTLEGDLSNDVYALPYEFVGTPGDVIVIEMVEVDILDDLDNPALQLLGPDGAVLVEDYGFSRVSLYYNVEVDGVYTIVATRRDGPDGDSVGTFALSLLKPQELGLGSMPVEGQLESGGSPQYYMYRGEEDFVVVYRKESGDMSVAVSVNVIDPEDGQLDDVAMLYGEEVNIGLIGTIPGGETYIIKLDRPPFSISFGRVTANYMLRLMGEVTLP